MAVPPSAPIAAPKPTSAQAPATERERGPAPLKGTKLQRTRALLVRNMAQRQGKKCLMVLVETMEDPTLDPRTRVMAALALLDRGFGKPAQEVQHTGKDGEPFRAIIELPPNFRTTVPTPIALLENKAIDAPAREITQGIIDSTVIPDEDDEIEFDDDGYDGDNRESFDV